MGKNKGSVTITDVAKEAGVSAAAVSKALNNRGGISIPVQRKIEKIAQRLGYSPYIKARQSGMYAGALKYIGVIYASAGEHLTREIQNGVDSVIQDSGLYELRYALNLQSQTYSEERKAIFLDKIMQDKSIAGLISVFLGISDSNIARLHKSGVPVVLLNNKSDCGMSVYIDNIEACCDAVKELIGLGRKKIGIIMPSESTENVWAQRLEGYKKALAENKIQYDPYLMVSETSFQLKESALATVELIEREPGVDAIIYGSDVQAYGGMEALKELNKRIPEDIAVAGFDDMTFSRVSDPPLSSVKQPMFEMGREGAKMLVEAIKEKDFSSKIVKLKSRIVLRQSTHKDLPREKLI
ncbi:MAG: LacI family DNA-binding transcriptional regulator [bacterium]|nr:LacI family DNA-binding transcriptional regulator [bacterium]